MSSGEVDSSSRLSRPVPPSPPAAPLILGKAPVAYEPVIDSPAEEPWSPAPTVFLRLNPGPPLDFSSYIY